MLERTWRNWSPCALLVGMENGAATMENGMAVPQKIKNRSSIWCSNSTSEYTPKRNESRDLKRYLFVHSSSRQHYSQWPESGSNPGVHRWVMDREIVVRTYEYNECYPALKGKENLTPAAAWGNLEDIITSEICQSPKDKHGTALAWDT